LKRGVCFIEQESRIIAEQLLLTLDYIHLKGIIHRDIKLDNVLVCLESDTIAAKKEKEIYVKIPDLGFAIVNPT
jgi:serine/threonine protein kinase